MYKKDFIWKPGYIFSWDLFSLSNRIWMLVQEKNNVLAID